MNVVPGRHAGRAYIVTGAGSGIGKAAALRLAAEGAKLAVCDLRQTIAEATLDEIVGSGGTAVAFAGDVSKEDDVGRMIGGAVTAFGGLDGLFSNAGTAGVGWLHETTLEDWNRVIGVNLTGAFLCAKHVLPHLLAKGGGCIVTTGSIAAMVIGAGGSSASYAASKGGLLQLTKQIAVDYGPQGIRAVCVLPGAVKTNLGVHAREDNRGQTTPLGEPLPRTPVRTPIARRARPDDIAATVSFLLSDDAAVITGCGMIVDCGYTAV
jgi:NAD(P)-dependent dehydrogenase (short-subunit alcohol dehydrogenase family)